MTNKIITIQSENRYTSTAIVFHWILAVGLFVNVSIALIYPYFGDQYIRLAIDSHKSIGITLFGLGILRLLWRMTHKPPTYPIKQSGLVRRLVKSTHGLLYSLIILIPLSGWMHDSAWKAANEIKMYWFGFFEWPRISWIMEIEAEQKEMLHSLFGGFHEWFSYTLYALVLLHIVGALKHHFSKTERIRGRGMI